MFNEKVIIHKKNEQRCEQNNPVETQVQVVLIAPASAVAAGRYV